MSLTCRWWFFLFAVETVVTRHLEMPRRNCAVHQTSAPQNDSCGKLNACWWGIIVGATCGRQQRYSDDGRQTLEGGLPWPNGISMNQWFGMSRPSVESRCWLWFWALRSLWNYGFTSWMDECGFTSWMDEAWGAVEASKFYPLLTTKSLVSGNVSFLWSFLKHSSFVKSMNADNIAMKGFMLIPILQVQSCFVNELLLVYIVLCELASWWQFEFLYSIPNSMNNSF